MFRLFRLEEAETAYQSMFPVVIYPLYRGMVHARLCAVAVLRGDWEVAYAHAMAADEEKQVTGFPVSGLWFHYKVEALLHQGDEDRAHHMLRYYEQRLGDNPRYRLAYLRALAVFARFKHEEEQTMNALREAVQLAAQMGLPGERWQIQATLGDVYESRAEKEQAQHAFAEATMIVRELTDRIQDETLRTSFLAAPQVQYVITRQVGVEDKV